MQTVSRTSITLAVAMLAATGARAKGEACRRIDAPIVTTYAFGPTCASPFGFCTAGTVGSGQVAGTTHFTVLTMGPNPFGNGSTYTGELVITTRSGTLTVHDSGVFDGVTYFEIQQVVSGTGAFAGATGALVSRGIGTPTGFSGTLTGRVCTEREQGREGSGSDSGDRSSEDREEE